MNHPDDRPGKLIKNVLAATLIFFIAACETKEAPKQSVPPPPPAKTADTAPPRSSAGVISYAEAVERVGPGVVTIRAARRVRAPRQHPFFNDPALRDLFGGMFGGAQSRGPAVQMGLGSGVIVQANGTILTNHHVVDGAEAIQVELTNKPYFRCETHRLRRSQ